ncbi:hypothetical protein L6164_021565 [Bauhinia variegata]|uniref:Uncharacterized protein n=1 Tax=Bauhinia variegata TaxID=167791 RepID=A0ACB9MZZ7_BAUVA|nr:hypothetical protein L6164_021565 [Bauhinia variegata]
MGNRVMDDTRGRQNYEAKEPYEFGDKAEDTREVMLYVPREDLDLTLSNLSDQSSASAFVVNAMDERAKTSHDGPEECQEVQEGAQGSLVSINKKREVESRPRREHEGESKKKKVESRPQKERKDKGPSRRQRLAAAVHHGRLG